MTRQQIALDTARALRSADPTQFPGLLGFDGFVDDIIDVVSERPPSGTYEQYTRIPTIAEFSQRTAAAAGHGTNLELVVKRQKLGGNGPIMGNALARLGMPLTYVGAVGDGAGIHKVFSDFAQHATLISLADAARTHALEFNDGKLMMGELASLSQITFAQLLKVVGQDRLIALCEGAALLGLLNWTMIPAATELWHGIAVHIMPRVAHRPRIFVDLADPKKRTGSDLVAALRVLTKLNALGAPCTLGLNEAESRQVAGILSVHTTVTLIELASAIREQLVLDTVVIHSPAVARAATAAGTAEFAGPYTPTPKILTGAGDHFNAGFALAQLLKLPLENALCLATAVSGYYVREAISPTVQDLASFLENLPDAA